ncbi:MAG: nitrite reductase, copper-containing [Candidatus Rokuibacteriota bacterium]|nr:MAG: nitrite reductase, copper-containing [Candidatus Rokubacteria bacterium]
MINLLGLITFVLALAIPGVARASDTTPTTAGHGHMAQARQPLVPGAGPGARLSKKSPAAEYTPNVRYRLRTELAEGKMAFVGVGGDIEGLVNPTLRAKDGDVVQVSLVNNDGIEHDLVFADFNAGTDRVNRKGASSVTVFRADQAGEHPYFCSLPGHRQAGMEGKLVVGGVKGPVAALPPATSVVRDPADLPGPLPVRAPRTLTFDLEAVELVGRLANQTTYNYWTFNGKVPGPFLRVRLGDTVELNFKNHEGSRMIHSIDLHAVTGPGGGAVVTQAPPGETKSFRFKALNPGLYVYHCATPMVANHISNGMYGLILVEPPEGLPKVDHEFYVMQGELYTDRPYGQPGHDEFSVEKLLAERAEYFVFNGAVGALTSEHPLKAKVGETVRIFFGVGGPNATSSFHVIGEIFDRVYSQAAVGSPAATNVQTTTVAPGGATIVEFKLEVPGRYILVDHALSRLERGLAGFLIVDGDDNPAIFHGNGPASTSGH